MSRPPSPSSSPKHPFPGAVDHQVLDLRHYQRVEPSDPDYSDFIVATIQEADYSDKVSFLRLERSRHGTPYSIRSLPQLYQKNPLALCLLRDFLAKNINRVPKEAKSVFGDVMLALREKEGDIDADDDQDVPDLRTRLLNLSDNPDDEGADTVSTMKCLPSPQEAILIQIVCRLPEYPLSIVFLACSASAAHLFDPVYRLFKQQSFWFAKVLMGAFLADGHVTIVQNQPPTFLVEDKVNYGEEGEPKLINCAVEDLFVDTINETRFCRDQMFGNFVLECRNKQTTRERIRSLRKVLQDSDAWIENYRLRINGMIDVFTALKVCLPVES